MKDYTFSATRKRIIRALVGAIGITVAQADILSVSGPTSVPAGTVPQIISAPAYLLNQCATNTGMQGFNERQQVTTTADHATDGGVIPMGTTFVNSHMIFLNQAGATADTGLSHENVLWTFDFPVLGVMSDTGGQEEATSSGDFGAIGTDYATVPAAPATTNCGTNNTTAERAAPFADRGIESNDSYTVSGNTITLNLHVTQPGDWVRVLTRGQQVGIDIKPGGYPNCFNINGNGVVPVAILGSSSLNVSNINPATLNFNGLAVRIKGNNQNQCSVQDVNGDSVPDLVCQFQDNTANWVQGSTVGTVSGQLNDGTPILGHDSICVVP